LARGYSVTACDISAEMVAEARGKFPELADRFVVADMRALPPLGEFDLVLCLDDAIKYLLSDAELDMTFGSMARVVSPTAVFAFDVNSLRTYRTSFAEDIIRSRDSVFMAWTGEASPNFGQRDIACATVTIFAERADGLWERSSTQHVQRHHSADALTHALA